LTKLKVEHYLIANELFSIIFYYFLLLRVANT